MNSSVSIIAFFLSPYKAAILLFLALADLTAATIAGTYHHLNLLKSQVKKAQVQTKEKIRNYKNKSKDIIQDEMELAEHVAALGLNETILERRKKKGDLK